MFSTTLCCTLWGLAALGAAAGEAELVPLAGAATRGPLTALSSQQVTVGPATLGVAAIREVRLSGEPRAAAPLEVRLIDGSRIGVHQYLVKSSAATLQLTTGEAPLTAETSTRNVAVVVFQRPDEKRQKQWDDLLQLDDVAGDRVVFRRGAGEEAELDHLEGVLHDVGEEVVEFDFDGDRIESKRAKLDGLTYFHAAERKLAPLVARVITADGSRWNASQLALDDGAVRLTTPAGVTASLPLELIRKIDFGSINLVYLSELQWETMEFRPTIPIRNENLLKWYHPRRDRKMVLAKQPFEKGLGLHTRTRLTYRLTEEYRKFQALVGIDDSIGKAGNPDVLLTVKGDERVLLEKQIVAGEPPLALDVDLAGVKRLEILVEHGDSRSRALLLDLCEARLIK